MTKQDRPLLLERVGWPADRCDPWACIRAVERNLAAVPRPTTINFIQATKAKESDIAAISFYFLEEFTLAQEWGDKVLMFGEEYFFGGWRDTWPSGEFSNEPPNPLYWRKLAWQDEWLPCLLWGSVLARWETLTRLATYFADDIPVDIEQSDANRAWLLIVAGVLCGRAWNEMEHHTKMIGGSRAKREKLLLDFLDTILHADDEQLASTASAYFKYYKSTEWKKPFINNKIMLDGSFLIHFAEHRGRSIPIPSNIVDHVVRLPREESGV